LNIYNNELDKFKDAGAAHLVAISPQNPDSSLSMKERHDLKFEVLSDVGSKVAQMYGVSYVLPDILKEKFGGHLDLQAYNSDDSYRLPIAVTYIIGKDGIIRYAFLDSDYRKRAEPADLIAALKDIQASY